EIVGKVLAAMACGGIIGMERELAQRPAGFRTHMIISAACALLVGAGPAMVQMSIDAGHGDRMEFDPYRILGAVVTGISFLGAGTIMRRRSENTVEGLTTAGSLLLAGAIGVVVALELWVVAIAMTVISLLVLRVFNMVERWIAGRFSDQEERGSRRL